MLFATLIAGTLLSEGGSDMPMLKWAGKDKVVNHHNEVPFRVLERKWGCGNHAHTEARRLREVRAMTINEITGDVC